MKTRIVTGANGIKYITNEPFKPDYNTEAVLVEEIQRMAKRIEELEKPVECMCGICKLTQRRPLTDEAIYAMCKDFHNWAEWDEYQKLWFDLCRAIEAAHGIKETEK